MQRNQDHVPVKALNNRGIKTALIYDQRKKTRPHDGIMDDMKVKHTYKCMKRYENKDYERKRKKENSLVISVKGKWAKIEERSKSHDA